MGFFDDIQQNTFQQFAPTRGRKPGILDRVLGLYGSDPATHIPDGRNEALRKGLQTGAQALTQASLGGQNMSAMNKLNVALQGLQQGGPQMAQERKQQQLQALLQSGSPADLQLAMRQAMAMGDMQMATLISNHLNQQQRSKQAGVGSKARGIVTQMPGEDGTMKNVLLDPTTGDVLKELGPVQPERGVVIDTVDGDGNAIKMLVDPRTGERIGGTYGQKEKGPGQYESEAASRLNQFSIARENIVENLEKLGRGPTWAEWQLYNSDLPGRKAIGNEMQGLLQAQNIIVTQIAKEIGGVRGAASPSFRNVIARTYLIAPGDQPLNMEQTLEALQEMENDLRRKAGGAFDLNPAEYIEEGADIADGVDGPPVPPGSNSLGFTPFDLEDD